MKTFTTISAILFSVASYGQTTENKPINKNDTTKYFAIGDRIISCSDCIVDFCGNITNSKGDTLGLNSWPISSDGFPIYFTKDNILLSQNFIKKLIDKKKVKSVSVIKCNEGQKIFKDLAKNGIIILELKGKTIKSKNLLEYLNKTHPDKNILITDILINGLVTTDKNIKYPKGDELIINYDTKKNIYNIKTE